MAQGNVAVCGHLKDVARLLRGKYYRPSGLSDFTGVSVRPFDLA